MGHYAEVNRVRPGLRRLAMHEATHHTCAVGVFGLTVESVSIEPARDGKASGWHGLVQLARRDRAKVQPKPTRQVAVIQAALLISGVVGEAIAGNHWGSYREHFGHPEVKLAWDYIAAAYPACLVDNVLEDVWSHTRKRLSEPVAWASSCAVANALIVCGKLSGKAALKIAHRAAVRRAAELKSQRQAA